MSHDIIRALETRLRSAMLNSDLAELDVLLADDLVFVSQNGQIFSKADDLAIHRAGRQRIECLETSDMHLILAADTAIVVVKAKISGWFDGQPFSGLFRYSRVWLYRDDNWRVATAHCSTIVS